MSVNAIQLYSSFQKKGTKDLAQFKNLKKTLAHQCQLTPSYNGEIDLFDKVIFIKTFKVKVSFLKQAIAIEFRHPIELNQLKTSTYAHGLHVSDSLPSNQIILMSRDFFPIYEANLDTEEITLKLAEIAPSGARKFIRFRLDLPGNSFRNFLYQFTEWLNLSVGKKQEFVLPVPEQPLDVFYGVVTISVVEFSPSEGYVVSFDQKVLFNVKQRKCALIARNSYFEFAFLNNLWQPNDVKKFMYNDFEHSITESRRELTWFFRRRVSFTENHLDHERSFIHFVPDTDTVRCKDEKYGYLLEQFFHCTNTNFESQPKFKLCKPTILQVD